MEKKIVKYQTTKATKQDDRVLRFIGSDERVDRDGDKVMLSGWDLKDYRKNPVVMFGHDLKSAPVARAKRVWIDKVSKQLMFDVEFPEADISSVGDSLYKLYKSGFMKATSVGFIPNYEKVTYPEKRMKDGTTRIIDGQKLHELSLVSVGSNQRALLTSKSMKQAIEENIIDQLELDELLLWVKSISTTKTPSDDAGAHQIVSEGSDKVIELESKVAELELLLIDKELYEEEPSIYDELWQEYKPLPVDEDWATEAIEALKE